MVAGVLLLLIGLVLITGKAFVPYVIDYFPKLVESLTNVFAKKDKPTHKTCN